MAETILAVRWKDHSSELATVYKSLLENNFLVDCTISAEGQNVKAHRLVLSACSPYFHKLFSEETGKHPFVVLLDASFETLKALIDFVYRGETQIPEGILREFLALARSLQIKGLNVFMQDCENKNLSSRTTENATRGPSRKNQVTSEVQGNVANQEESRENSSRKRPHRYGYTDSVTPSSSVPFEGHNVLSSEEMSTPLQDQWRSQDCYDVPVAVEIAVKNESYSAYSEVRSEKLDIVGSDEPMSGNFTSNRDDRTSSVGVEEDLNLFASYSETSRGNMEPSKLPSSQQQLMHLGDQTSSAQDIAEGSGPSVPALLVPKSEQLNDEESEEPMDYPDDLGNDTSERVEEAGPACDEQNIGQCSRADGLLPVDVNVLAIQQRSGLQLWSCETTECETPLPHSELQPPKNRGADSLLPVAVLATQQWSGLHVWSHGTQESKTPLPNSELQLPKVQVEKPDLSSKGHEAPVFTRNLPGHKPTHKRNHSCNICKASFINRSRLVDHFHVHRGEQPYHCDVCGKQFTNSRNLSNHKRCHTGERPYHCNVCGKQFATSSSFYRHKRGHTGERPHVCDMCGKQFAVLSNFFRHKRRHTGERPYICDVCGKGYICPTGLKYHKKTHVK